MSFSISSHKDVYSHGHPSSIVFSCRSSHFDAKFQMKIEIWHQNVMKDKKKLSNSDDRDCTGLRWSVPENEV